MQTIRQGKAGKLALDIQNIREELKACEMVATKLTQPKLTTDARRDLTDEFQIRTARVLESFTRWSLTLS